MPRPPKPASLKRLAGNPGKRRIPDEPDYGPLKRLPRVPKSLGKPGRRLWRELGKALIAAGVLTRADLPAFTLLCQHWDMAQRALWAISEDGVVANDDHGLPRKHPLLQVWRDNSKAWREYAARFGLTPVDRAKIGLVVAQREKSLAELLFESVPGGEKA